MVIHLLIWCVVVASGWLAPPQRLKGNPILTPASHPSLGDNLNGPSLIRVPDWVVKPLGRYYLYFAHHRGTYIRLAYADQVGGPWTVHEPGTLKLSEAPACFDHVASPDVHVDRQRKEILMYYHCQTAAAPDAVQSTFLAVSSDGLRFATGARPVGPWYLRVFEWRGAHYAIARAGLFVRSPDGRGPFTSGPSLFGGDPRYVLRHAAVDLRGDVLDVYYSRIGDTPERILLSRVMLTDDWMTWHASDQEDVLRPETTYEGADLPIATSVTGDATRRMHELRDPGIFKDGGRTYLLYSIAGESGLAIADLGPTR